MQCDNAGDNKNQYLLFVSAWLVAKGIVNEVEVSMLVVGHTHEDIDQFFSVPSRHFRALDDQLVRDIKEFFEHCKAAFKSGQHVKVCHQHAACLAAWHPFVVA